MQNGSHSGTTSGDSVVSDDPLSFAVDLALLVRADADMLAPEPSEEAAMASKSEGKEAKAETKAGADADGDAEMAASASGSAAASSALFLVYRSGSRILAQSLISRPARSLAPLLPAFGLLPSGAADSEHHRLLPPPAFLTEVRVQFSLLPSHAHAFLRCSLVSASAQCDRAALLQQRTRRPSRRGQRRRRGQSVSVSCHCACAAAASAFWPYAWISRRTCCWTK